MIKDFYGMTDEERFREYKLLEMDRCIDSAMAHADELLKKMQNKRRHFMLCDVYSKNPEDTGLLRAMSKKLDDYLINDEDSDYRFTVSSHWTSGENQKYVTFENSGAVLLRCYLWSDDFIKLKSKVNSDFDKFVDTAKEVDFDDCNLHAYFAVTEDSIKFVVEVVKNFATTLIPIKKDSISKDIGRENILSWMDEMLGNVDYVKLITEGQVPNNWKTAI